MTYGKSALKFEEYLADNGIDIEDIGSGILGDFVEALVQKGYKSTSVNTWIPAIRKYLEFLRSKGVQLPYVERPDLPSIQTAPPVSLSDKELGAFMVAASKYLSEPARTALIIMPFCGLRSFECATIRLKDIEHRRDDKDAKRTNVFFRTERKGGNIGEVPLLQEGALFLGKYLSHYRLDQNQIEKRHMKSPYLFPGDDAGHISTRTMRDAIDHVREMSGLHHLKTHMLRKTFATRLHQNGVSLSEIAKYLGHRNTSTTQNSYIGHDIDHSMKVVRDIKILPTKESAHE